MYSENYIYIERPEANVYIYIYVQNSHMIIILNLIRFYADYIHFVQTTYLHSHQFSIHIICIYLILFHRIEFYFPNIIRYTYGWQIYKHC